MKSTDSNPSMLAKDKPCPASTAEKLTLANISILHNGSNRRASSSGLQPFAKRIPLRRAVVHSNKGVPTNKRAVL